MYMCSVHVKSTAVIQFKNLKMSFKHDFYELPNQFFTWTQRLGYMNDTERKLFMHLHHDRVEAEGF